MNSSITLGRNTEVFHAKGNVNLNSAAHSVVNGPSDSSRQGQCLEELTTGVSCLLAELCPF